MERKLSIYCRIIIFTLLTLAVFALSTDEPSPPGIFYGTGQWDADAFGNHRALAAVSEKADAVWVHIPWRRRDLDPDKKNIIVVDASTGAQIGNLYRARINREAGDLIFQPVTVPGQYHIYYLPSISSGSRNYPKVTYPVPGSTAEFSWLERHGLRGQIMSPKQLKRFPQARILELQSIDSFNSFFPMEVIASSREVQSLLKRHAGDDFLVFPETREYPIRMTDDLPLKWKATGTRDVFRAVVAPGEFYVFQLGVYAARLDIVSLSLVYSGLKDAGGNIVVPPEAFRCFNLEGTDWQGNLFRKEVKVVKGKFQALWVGFQAPASLPAGQYQGEVTVAADRAKEKKVLMLVTVKGPRLTAGGDDEPDRLSRLRWLDSQLAADDTLVPPFTPLTLSGRSLTFLGRKVSLDDSGFPESIFSFFDMEMTRLSGTGRPLLQSPMRLVVENASGEALTPKGRGVVFTRQAEGAIQWESGGIAGSFTLDLKARIEFDGYLEYKVSMKALRETDVRDIRLEIPLNKDAARYMMGMGYRGGLRPKSFQWTWDQKKNQDSVWIGDVNAGVQIGLHEENYIRPLNTNFYLLKPLNMPPSWHNSGRGGCRMLETDSQTFRIDAYSGPRTVAEGEELHFNFTMLLTPFKLLDTAGQWSTRYYHDFKPLDEIRAAGANTVNIHHATPINPYINYPFLRPVEMKKYVDEAHAKGMKVKIYYTVRELSNHAPELFAISSLGSEILAPGPGGGFAWLQEHLNGNYIAGWLVPALKDAALINSGVSRWHNYYVEGLAWLVNNIGIDGLYIDDVAFDRSVMKRVRRILDGKRAGALIDLHSANQYNERDGFASSANLYLEHFPYLNRLWFGEYFDYDSPPDYWLVEISGIPFGLMGEMLQNGGNPWRGMVHGMTSRLPWSGDPRPIWEMWDDFGVQDSRMIGYWLPQSPVRPANPYVLATVFVKKDKVLIALASWAKEMVECRLLIDWQALAMNPKTAVLTAPEIKDFQPQASFSARNAIPVEQGKGWLLILQDKEKKELH